MTNTIETYARDTAIHPSWSYASNQLRHQGQSVSARELYEDLLGLPSWLEGVIRQVRGLETSDHPPISAEARHNAEAVARHLWVQGALPEPAVGSSAEGGVALFYDLPGKYADFECLNSGTTLASFTDFGPTNTVFELDPRDSDQVARVSERIRDFFR